MPCALTLARCAVMLLALCVGLDAALPLLPGAFRILSATSVEVGGSLASRPELAAVSDTGSPGPTTARRASVTRAETAPATRPERPRVTPRRIPAPPDSTRSPDDH